MILWRSLLLHLSLGCVAASSLRAQPDGGIYHCGAHSPTRYGVVLDASSSVRRTAAETRATVRAYDEIIRLLAGQLCQSDTLLVYPFPSAAQARMVSLGAITANDRSSGVPASITRKVLDQRGRHSDLLLVLRSMETDLFQRGIRRVFVLTDGSFYPAEANGSERTPEGIRARLDSLRSQAAVMADSGREFVVIGVRADQEYAIDVELGVPWPDHAGDRQWPDHNPFDLQHALGHHLLVAVFGTRYFSATGLSLWHLIMGVDRSETDTTGYSDGWGLGLRHLQGVSIEHLLFTLPPRLRGQVTCGHIRPKASGSEPRAEAAPDGIAQDSICSLQHPTSAELFTLDTLGVRDYLFHQRPRPHFGARDGELIRGVHQVTVPEYGYDCNHNVLSSHFSRGLYWPKADATVLGELKVVPLPGGEPSRRFDLVRYEEDRCLIPRFTGVEWQFNPGRYALIASDQNGGAVLLQSIATPGLRTLRAMLRPGGFPFPPGLLALVDVCVQADSAVASYERVWMLAQGKRIAIPLAKNDSNCQHAAGITANANVYGYRGLVPLDGGDFVSTKFFVGSVGADPISPRNGDWIPAQMVRRGRFFLPWLWVIVAALVGALFQVVTLFALDKHHASGVSWPRRKTAWLSVLISGILVLVTVEFVVVLFSSHLDKHMFLILAHLATMFAAAAVPEYVEESVLS